MNKIMNILTTFFARTSEASRKFFCPPIGSNVEGKFFPKETQEMKKQAPRIAQDELKVESPTPDTPVFNLSDFEDYVSFHTKCDIAEHGDSIIDENISQKKCPFCD